MSLTRTLLRIATIKSLEGRTLAGDAVFDSMIEPIDARISEAKRPIIAVYTDDQQSQIDGRADFLQGGTCELVIEIIVAGKMAVQVEGPDGLIEAAELSIPSTDSGLEISLDILESQVTKVLTGDHSEWARLWRDVSAKINTITSRRGASAGNGVRFAARQLTLTLEPIVDPPRGEPVSIDLAWGMALDLMARTTDLSSIAAIMRAEIEGEPATEWRRTAQRLGVNLEIVHALGLGPVAAEDPVLLTDGDAVEVNR